MKKVYLSSLLGIFLTLFLSLSTKAQMVGADVFLQGDYVEVGIGNGGWYGSGAAGPAGFHGRTPGPTVGFVSDPDKDGWASGVPNYCGDYFVPGYPQEGWDLQVGSLWGKAWLGTGFVGGVTGANVSYSSTGTEMRGVWEGSFAGLAIRQTTILRKEKLYFLIKVTMKNTTAADITDIYYDRTLDPDNVSTMNPSSIPGIITSSGSSTVNTIEFKLPNPKSRSLVSAIGELTVVKPTSPDTVDYPVYLGIGSKDCRARPYILDMGLTPGTADSPSRLYKNDKTLDHLYDTGETNTKDAGTGLIFNIERLKPGDSTTFYMAYVLSTSDLDSAFADMAPVWQYGGLQYESGDTIKLCRDKAAPDEIKSLNIGGGDEFTWTWSPRPGLKNLTGTINEIVLTNTPTTYVATPSEGFGCTDSMVITIMPYINPDPPTVTTPVTYCQLGKADPLEAKGMAGAIMKYYTVASGGFGALSYIPSTFTPGTFTYYASQLNGICESVRTPITIIVNPRPILDSFTLSNPTKCDTKDGWIKFKADKANDLYKVYYDKDGFAAPMLSITSDSKGYITIPFLGVGSYSAIYVVNSFGCQSQVYYGPIVLSFPLAKAPIVNNNGPICEGEIANLTTIPRDSTTYLWTGPGGFSSTNPNPSFTTKAGSSGKYTLIATKDGCPSLPGITDLIVNPNPINQMLPDQIVCEGNNLSVEVLTELNTTYSWTGGNDDYSSLTANLQRPSIQSKSAGQYIFFSVTDMGCSTYDTINVSVEPRVQLTHSMDTSICQKDTITLFANTNTNSVVWKPGTGINDSSSKTPRVSPSETTTYTVIAKSNTNTCPDTSGQVTVTVIPAPFVKGYDTLVRMNIPYTILPTYGQEVSKWKWVPADSLSCSNCPNPTFNSSKNISYTLIVADQNGCESAAQLNIRVFCDGANLTMPNAFTPNGDGQNDIFYVRGTGFSVKTFSIYNRNGQEVFKKENFLPNDPQYGWNGFFGGQAISDAAGFVYMIEVICLNSGNEPILLKGTVLMIK